MPGCSVSLTTKSFCSVVNRRRRATPAIISIFENVSDYPSVDAFIDMTTSADYENRCDPHRSDGCAKHVIICTREAYSKFKIG